MTKSDFWIHYSSNIEYGLMWLGVSGIIYFLFFKRYVYSIFDPLALHLLMSACASSVVLFMYQLSLIHVFYFESFLYTQFAFIFGFTLVKPINKNLLIVRPKKTRLRADLSTKYIYHVSFFTYIISQAATYYAKGIPLLMEARLEAYSGGSGFGIFGRIVAVSSVVSLVISLQNILFSRKQSYVYNGLVIIVVVSGAMLSGSKTEIMSTFFILFFVLLFNFRTSNPDVLIVENKIDRYKWLVIPLSTIAVLGVINIQVYVRFGPDNTINPVMVLLMRFINTADGFFLAYPGGFINSAQEANSFLALFSSLFGVFRVLSWDSLPDSITLQLHQSLYDTNLVEGPNSRHNIFGLFYYGKYISVFFSFILGFLVSYLRNRVYFLAYPSVNGMILYILLALNALAFEVDPVMAISNCISILIIFFPIYIMSKILSLSQTRCKNHLYGT